MTALLIIVVIAIVGSLVTALLDSVFGYGVDPETSKLANYLHHILVSLIGICVGIFTANSFDMFRF